MTFQFGTYRSDPTAPPPLWPWRFCADTRLYLAILPGARFVRAAGPAEGFDFRGLVDRLTVGIGRPGDDSRRPEIPPYETGTYSSGRWELRLRTTLGLDGRAGGRQWAVRVAAPDVLVGPDALYRLTERIEAEPLPAAPPVRRPVAGRR